MNEKFYHINVAAGDVGKYVILPGDPGRTDLIAKYLKNPVLISENREYRIWNGYINETMVSVVSTGIGGASTAIAIEELIKAGSHTFIRVGTAGRVSSKAQNKEISGVICTSAVRDEGLTTEYVPLSYPAVANIDVINALTKSAKELDLNYIQGISHCKESYYGQVEPNRIPLGHHLNEQWEVLKKANVSCAEMESSTIFVLSSIYEKRSGSIMTFDDNMDKSIQIAVKAIEKLIDSDNK